MNWKNTILPWAISTILFCTIFVPLVLMSGNSNTSQNVQFIVFGFSALIVMLVYIGIIWRPSRKMDKKYNVDSTWELEAKRDYPDMILTFTEFKKIKTSSDRTIFLATLGIVIGQVVPLIITALIK